MKTYAKIAGLAFILNANADWSVRRITTLLITSALWSLKREVSDSGKCGLPIELLFENYEVSGSVGDEEGGTKKV